jgi:AcrR family transcriptional regulator
MCEAAQSPQKSGLMANPPKTSEEAIVAATIEIIEQQGTESLSVRAVARKLGLAPNALYYRFRKRKMLEAAVAAQGMRGINAVLKKTAARLRGEEAIRRACRSYLRYGRSHPAVYAMLMKKYPEAPGLLAEREGFREGLARLLASLGDQPAASEAGFALWALLHGLVELEAEGLLEPLESAAGASYGVAALMAGLSRS